MGLLAIVFFIVQSFALSSSEWSTWKMPKNLSLILKNWIHPSTSPYCVQWKTDRNILSTHVCILHRASDLWGFWLIVPQFCFLEVLRMSKWWCSIYLSTLKKVPFYDNLESRSTTKAAVLSTHLNVKLDNVTLDYLFN